MLCCMLMLCYQHYSDQVLFRSSSLIKFRDSAFGRQKQHLDQIKKEWLTARFKTDAKCNIFQESEYFKKF